MFFFFSFPFVKLFYKVKPCKREWALKYGSLVSTSVSAPGRVIGNRCTFSFGNPQDTPAH